MNNRRETSFTVKTLICAGCRRKFDVDPKAVPRRYSGLCDECSAKRPETFVVGDVEFEVVRRLTK